MFYYIKGELAVLLPGLAVVDCGGVGYQCTVSRLTSDALESQLGKTVKLYTHLAVREDGIELFGFGSNEERGAFQLLTSVSGVGPKAGMSILSTLTPNEFSIAVCTENVAAIAKANGIGKKTAQRIILELKDKIAKERGDEDLTLTASKAAPTRSVGGHLTEAVEALMVLGYDKNSALRALDGLDPKTEVGELIRLALKKIAR